MTTKTKTQQESWEIKDRTYLVKGINQPLTLKIPSRHTTKHSLLWFDEKLNEQREIRYATNQNSPFKDEQKGEATLGHIIFKDGSLTVKKKEQALQKILSLYHPLKGNKYNELDVIEDAKDELVDLELEIDALNIARGLDVDEAEAILRVEMGSKVSEMSSKEIKRDLLMFAKDNAELFLNLAKDDNVQLRNFAIKATEAGIIKLASDQKTFQWATNGKKLMTVPFDEHPYAAMASFFKTDEGLDIYKSIEKKLS
mgnify:CR=1 FL=1|jgi:hypothetical protein|tara:strand:- start:2720 stop:3484 length:765 start_codon:yes stop_codon:yes gene_type:complete